MLIGYARVPATGQRLEAQIGQLRNAGCGRIHQDRRTGYDRRRVGPAGMPGDISNADTPVVTSPAHDLFEITRSLETRGASFRSLRKPWADTASLMGKFLLTVSAGLSELERSPVRERTEEGRQSARRRGVRFGRKPKLTTHRQSQVARMLAEGQSIRSIARHFNVGVATVDRSRNARSTPT